MPLRSRGRAQGSPVTSEIGRAASPLTEGLRRETDILQGGSPGPGHRVVENRD